MNYRNNQKEERKIKIILGAVLSVLVLLTINPVIDNDFWFLLKGGDYVMAKGIPYTEPFTMHQGWDFVMQQWLSSVIFASIYNMFDSMGMFIFMGIISVITTLVIYKICLYITDNNVIISFVLSSLYIVINIFTCVTRPKIFTALIFAVELYYLEKFIKEQKTKYLLALPIISVLEINLHASMWWMIIVLMLPYVADSINIPKLKIKGENKKIIPLLLSMVVVFIAGLINPYGINAITYLFRSYGLEEISGYISEMKGLNVNDVLGMIMMVIMLLLILVYVFYRKGTFKIRYFFLTLGTTYLMLSAYRSIFIFSTGALFPMAYYLKDVCLPKSKKEQEPNRKKINVLLGILCIVIVATVAVKIVKYDDLSAQAECREAVEYLKANYNPDDVVLFTTYEDGGYAEYLGFKPYMDARAEVFVKKNNGKADVMKEYNRLEDGDIYYKDVFDKYKFTHAILYKKGLLYTYISRDKDYKQIYSDEKRVIYEYVGKNRN